MTRRKQNAPKRLKSTDKTGENGANQDTEQSNNVTSDSQEEDEDEGDSNDEDCPCPLSNSPSDSREEGNSEHTIERKEAVAVKEDDKSDLDNLVQNSCLNRVDENYDEDRSSKYLVSSRLGNMKSELLDDADEKRYLSSKTLITNCPTTQSSKPGSPLSSQHHSLSADMVPLDLVGKMRKLTSQHSSSRSNTSAISPLNLELDSGDQPLDLSTKQTKSHSPVPSKSVPSLSPSMRSLPLASFPASNGFSSLQSLQDRFGGSHPLELSRRPSGASVIPLQPSMASATATFHPQRPTPEEVLHLQGLTVRSKEKIEGRMSRSPTSPMQKGEISLKHASSSSSSAVPSFPDDGSSDARSKHTIHRCSCQKSFSSLYSLSLHIQESGHTPLTGKALSLMDYPKLVRGQDMWLNQESEQTRRILRCMQCGESFKSLPLLTVHMMQTQHHTKIVSFEHGRRSHKCSTYCDRDLDRECIFKCKVCQDAFPDMEGLANHMIVSGHHKKQSSSRTGALSSHSSFIDSAGSLPFTTIRHGKRKRFMNEEEAEKVCNALELSKKHIAGERLINGLNKDNAADSPPSTPTSTSIPTTVPFHTPKQVLCDSCGRRVDVKDFDSHVRACLRQRAEVIDALKSKLAAEEALLSRSEIKLLKSGFHLSPVSGSCENLPSMQTHPISESEQTLQKHRTMLNKIVSDKLKSQNQKLSSPNSGTTSSSVAHERENLDKVNNKNVRICDIEVPLKNWSSDSSNEETTEYQTEKDDKEKRLGTGSGSYYRHRSKDIGSDDCKESHDFSHDRKSVRNEIATKIKREALSPVVENDTMSFKQDALKAEAKKHLDSLDSKTKESKRHCKPLVNAGEPEDDLNFTSSALHKLDMFSRGLQLSTSKPSFSEETKIATSLVTKITKKKESGDSSTHKHQSSNKSSLAVSSSPNKSTLLSPGLDVKSEPKEGPSKPVTFDIIDPNSEPERGSTNSGALEAMESFIHKSFSAKSHLRSSSLASMFSPFGSCFPLPGSQYSHQGITGNSSDTSTDYFAKFSKFFGMIPGAPRVTSSPSPGYPYDCGIKTENSGEYRSNLTRNSPAIKVPAVRFPTSSVSPKQFKETKKTSDNCIRHKSGKLEDPASNVKKLGLKNNSPNFKPSGLQNGECRLPSSNELNKRQDSLLRKRKQSTDASPTVSKSHRVDEHNNKSYQDYKTSGNMNNHVSDELVVVKSEVEMKEERCMKTTTEERENTNFISDRHSRTHPTDRNDSPTSSHSSSEIHNDKSDKNDSMPRYSRSPNDQQTPPPLQIDTEKEKSDISLERDIENDTSSLCPPDVAVDAHRQANKYNINNSDDTADEFVQDKKVGGTILSKSRMESEDGDMDDPNNSFDEDDDIGCGDDDNEIDAMDNSKNDRRDDDDEFAVVMPKPNDCINDDIGSRSENESSSSEYVCKKLQHRYKDFGVNENGVKKRRKTSIELSVKMELDQGVENNNECIKSVGVATVGIDRGLSKEDRGEESRKSDDDEMNRRESDVFNFKKGGSGHVPDSPQSNVDFENDRDKFSKDRKFIRDSPPDTEDREEPFQRDTVSNGSSSDSETKVTDIESAVTKTSALDSLSSFVYSQPLTSEHPLDSLQRLFTPMGVRRMSGDGQSLPPTSSSSDRLTPGGKPLFPLNLATSRDNGGGGGSSVEGGSSDENDEADGGVVELQDGVNSEGEQGNMDFKCAACNRRFASKGSYRYHLSRCHLSSVKKYGIKEAFNMSPYVYLPLDHTAKFSKYYQMAQELANKGK